MQSDGILSNWSYSPEEKTKQTKKANKQTKKPVLVQEEKENIIKTI